MNEPQFIEVNELNLPQLIGQSETQPVLLFIGMDGDPTCDQQWTQLQGLATQLTGKITLAKVDGKTEQMLAQSLINQLQIHALPGIVLLAQGRPADALIGPQTPEALLALVEPHLMSPADRLREQVEALREAGELQKALTMLQGILKDEPDNHALQVLQVNLLLELGKIDNARQLIAALPDDAAGIAQPKAKLAFYELVAEAPQRAELEQRLQVDDNDHEARYQLAIREVISDDTEQALENLLVIVRRNRAFREDGARLLMLKIFDQLGQGNATAKRYRGKLFGLMH